MKYIFTFLVALATTATVLGQYSTNITVNTTIPDNDPNGIASTATVAGLGNLMNNVTVNLQINGGYNGDLYAYLSGPNGGFAVLLNRVGVSNSASQYGYSDAGFNVTFSDSAAHSVQYYQDYANPGGGQLTGTWQPDGVTVDPLTNNPAAFFGAPQTAALNSFDNTSGNGTWTLFLADLAAGNQSTVVGWSLDITTVPEPTSWNLAATGILATWLLLRRRK